MNETTSLSILSWGSRARAVRYLAFVVLAIVALASGCRGGSNDGDGAASGGAGGGAVLEAVAYSRPQLALDTASDATLVDYGDLVFNTADLANGYVLDNAWCDRNSARCVTVNGDEFGGEPLASFVVDTDYSVDDPGFEIVDLRALRHPVSNQLRLVLDVKPTEQTWRALYQPVQVITDSTEFESNLEGPDNAVVGVVSRYELARLDEPVSGPLKLIASFDDGSYDGDEIQVTITLDDSPPEIDRPEAPLGERQSMAIYRVTEPLDDEGGDDEDDGGRAAIAKLITAIVEHGDTTELVEPESPGAAAATALANTDRIVSFRHDPDDDTSLCWQSYGRGTFCERWHGGEVDDGVLTTWSIEGTSIDDLVTTRAGSKPDSAVTLVRAPSSDLVLASTSVTNATTTDLDISLYRPDVQRGDLVEDPITASGGYDVAAGTTETGNVLIEMADFDFDLIYTEGSGRDATYLRFDADAAPAQATSGEPASTDRSAESVRLASRLQKQRFDDAVAEAAPGSPAEAYLTAFAATTSDTSFQIDGGAESSGSTRVCARNPAIVCTTVEVTEVDSEGRIADFTIEGTDVATLLVEDRGAESGDFEAKIDHAVLWPKWGVFADWSVTNESGAEVTVSSVALVSPAGVITTSERSVYDDLPDGRTITGNAYFAESSLDGAIEIRGSGRDAVRELTLVVPLDDSYDSIESDVELEAEQTEFETHAGTKLSVPGDWSEMIWYDEDTNKIAGDGTSLGRVKSIYRDDMTVLAFSPDFAPQELSSDQLTSEINALAELSEVDIQETTTIDGKPLDLLAGKTAFFGELQPTIVLPGPEDLIFVTWKNDPPAHPEELVTAGNAIAEQLGITIP